MIVVFKRLVTAFSGERFPVARTLRVNTRTGAIEVYCPLKRRWTTDHALSENAKHDIRLEAASRGA